MKKNMMKAALVAVVGLIAGINVYNAQKSDVMSDIALANVEALANDEASGPCKGLGYVYCTYNGYWVEYQLKN